MRTAVAKMAPDRHVANRVIILVSAMYRSADIQEWSALAFQRSNIDKRANYDQKQAVKEIVQEEGIGLISVGLDGSVGAMKPLKGYDVTQIRELNGIREQVKGP